MGLHLTTRHGNTPSAQVLLEAPYLDDCEHVVVCGSYGALGALSLSMEDGIYLPLEVWQESGPNFKGLQKVSGVATNH